MADGEAPSEAPMAGKRKGGPPGGMAAGGRPDLTGALPALEANIMGTARLLAWAGRQPDLDPARDDLEVLAGVLLVQDAPDPDEALRGGRIPGRDLDRPCPMVPDFEDPRGAVRERGGRSGEHPRAGRCRWRRLRTAAAR